MLSNATRLLCMICGPLLLTLLIFFSGGPVTNSAAPLRYQSQATLGQEFLIRVGQQVKIGEDLHVKFVSVPEDSRCPSDVTCVWAGNAALAIDVIEGKCTTILTLNTYQGAKSTENGKVGPYRVKLVKLDPYPRSTQKIPAGDYTATLVVTKE